MTADDVLDEPGVYTRALEVRSVGPAVAIIVEHDSPPRLETLCESNDEYDVLFAALDSTSRRLLETYFEGHDEVALREEAHASRLDMSTPVYTNDAQEYERFRRETDADELRKGGTGR